MKFIYLFKKSTLVTFIAIILSACTSGGTGTESGLNITGNWRGTADIRGTVFEVNMTLAQSTTSAGGIKDVPIDGNLLIVGFCVYNFAGGSLNIETGTFTVGPGDDVSVIGTAVNNSLISATISGVDSSEDSCGVFKTSVITFNRF